jgi:hypothetical protein
MGKTMRKLALLTAVALTLCAAGSSAQAGGWLPPWLFGEQLLVYGNAPELYAAGCLKWNSQQRSWYNYCRPTEPVVVAKY